MKTLQAVHRSGADAAIDAERRVTTLWNGMSISGATPALERRRLQRLGTDILYIKLFEWADVVP
jgi:hypothetical protein